MYKVKSAKVIYPIYNAMPQRPISAIGYSKQMSVS